MRSKNSPVKFFASRSTCLCDRCIASRCSGAPPMTTCSSSRFITPLPMAGRSAFFIQDLCAAYVQRGDGACASRFHLCRFPYTAWGAAERAFWQPSEIEQRARILENASCRQRAGSGARAETTASGAPQRWVSHDSPGAWRRAARELARRNSATLFNTLLTAFQITLAQWTGADDIVVGTPVANRTRAGRARGDGLLAPDRAAAWPDQS